ncbi:Mirror-image polydactyly gene 1 protein [Stylophora pistillata]|uniref:Mirror-image polydactyly gene 1 protein n=1 Tax=Stylophora pistillata TaxID=50429 RepID=A0A2B4SJR8_STYPI|nr:Mirror-image polydactyly gene 1 protein [Stylophora pistillata]
MKGARQRITNLRLDLEEKDKLLDEEKSLRKTLEAELAEKTEELYKEKTMSLRTGNEGYLSMNVTSSFGEDTSSFREELSLAQRLNLQLTEKLSRAEAEIEASRVSRGELLAQTESKIAAQGAALVEKIYQAQKERDAAMNARLHMANSEREELIDKLRRAEREHAGFDSGVDSVYDEEETEPTMRSLFGRLTASETPELIDKNGHLMATKIRTVQKNRKKMVTEELKAVIAERDTAVEKAKALEAEVVNLRKEIELMKNQHMLMDKQRVKAIQFNQTMDSFETRLRARDADIQQAQCSYDGVVEKLKAVSQERTTLAKQLEEASKNRRREKERADKLERLVGVLRKRISETGGTSVATIN